MIISVASGKGGTGKTTVAVNLALALGKGVQFADCDVEEPNAHIFLRPEMDESRRVALDVPEIDESRCTHCGTCAEICEFNALAVLPEKVLTFEKLCHSCGGCALLCPEKAITLKPREIGTLEAGHVGDIPFVHGRLDVGEVLSPPLIREVKRSAGCGTNPTGIRPHADVVIVDAPPGTSCPVVAAVSGSDYCILVTEPTPFGLNDLDLAVQVLRELSIPSGVVINRSDIGDDGVERYCREQGIPVLLRIPFDYNLASAYARGEPIVREEPGYVRMFTDLFERIGNGS